MKKLLFLATLLCFGSAAQSQQIIDGTAAFQTDPAKKYSIYLPSTYQPANPNAVMLALHPLNTSRWNGKSWRDSLIAFAEANSLILICPDGGADGRIDDPIDTAFTSFLLDSAEIWFNLDKNRMYAMGFSWGGLTTYTYGLARPHKFGGYLPIGAAITGTSKFSQYAANAKGKPFYLLHGANDAVNSRYTPALNWLTANQAIVNSKLLPGVGHTIDFTNRNQFLTTAYKWLDSVNTATNSSLKGSGTINKNWNYRIENGAILITGEQIDFLKVYNIEGKTIASHQHFLIKKQIYLEEAGIYILEIMQNGKLSRTKILYWKQ